MAKSLNNVVQPLNNEVACGLIDIISMIVIIKPKFHHGPCKCLSKLNYAS